MTPTGIGNATTPIARDTLKRKLSNKSAKRALIWFGINLFLAVVCFLEMTYRSTAAFFDVTHPSLWYVTCTLSLLFTLNALVDLWRYVVPTLEAVSQPISLSPSEKSLLGVQDHAVGFKVSRQRIASAPASLSAPHTPSSSPSLKPPSHYLYSTPPPLSAALGGSPVGGQLGLNRSFPSQFSPSASPSSQGSILSPSGQSFSQTLGAASQTPTQNMSSSVLLRDASGSGGSLLRPRHRSSPARHSPMMTPETTISDEASLSSYLKSYEDKERRNILGTPDHSPGSSPSYWAYNRSAADFTYLLGKYQYQLASRSPQSPASRGKDDQDCPATYGAEEVWDRLEVDRETLDRWIANLRQWLSQTVLVPVVKEIGKVNKSLQRLGHGDLQVGDTSVSALRQIAILKSQHVPSLNMLLSYLDVSPNQEYVIQRYKELARGGYLCEFRWDQGGEQKGRKWHKDLPTDCVLVLHALCTYLDSCLPPHPKHPDGKTFTDQYFKKTPDKPDLKRENLLLYQSKVDPPHFKVILGDDTWDIPMGRSNMFQAILLFLHHIKTKENGMLGRVNLGPSGVNILWVIDS
ncbi:transmembrane protein 209-like [Diadema setosum]|uniref:transmembrane protein 209-like n=1 Tax=Diadema setosum TaxID=31175 RepID=UPI003B3AD60B